MEGSCCTVHRRDTDWGYLMAETICQRCGGTRLAPSRVGVFRGTCHCRCGRAVSLETKYRIDGYCVLLRGHAGPCSVNPSDRGAA